MKRGPRPRPRTFAEAIAQELRARALPKAAGPGRGNKTSPTNGLLSKSAALDDVGVTKQRAAEVEKVELELEPTIGEHPIDPYAALSAWRRSP